MKLFDPISHLSFLPSKHDKLIGNILMFLIISVSAIDQFVPIVQERILVVY